MHGSPIPGAAQRPVVSVYNANASNIAAVYDTAVANGADTVVGPLEKAAVAVLAGRAELAARTLALNTTDGDSNHAFNFFQFGLTPEDEAIATADKVWADGYARVVAMAPLGPWGERGDVGFRRSLA